MSEKKVHLPNNSSRKFLLSTVQENQELKEDKVKEDNLTSSA